MGPFETFAGKALEGSLEEFQTMNWKSFGLQTRLPGRQYIKPCSQAEDMWIAAVYLFFGHLTMTFDALM